MRVLLVADFYPPAPGGLEAHVRRLGQELRRAGHEVAVVAGGPHASTVDDNGVPVHVVPSGIGPPVLYRQPGRAFHPPWPHPAVRRGIAAAIERYDPQVVHAHGWCQFSAAAAARRRPLVVTLHDYGLRCPKKNLLRGTNECVSGLGLRCVTCPGTEQATVKRCLLGAALGRTAPRLAGRVDRFLAVSSHVARRHLQAHPGPVDVLPNFLDLPSGPPTPPGEREVLFVGPADRHKGLAVLLRAWRLVPPGLGRLVVVGTDGPPGGMDGVQFAGRLSGGPLWTRYHAAALVVVPPIWPEPCPTVVLEALAHGRPVVASRVGGIPDLVVHGTSGLLVPPGDPDALAAAIAGLLGAGDRPAAARSRLEAMGRAAAERSRTFATSTVVRRIERVYAEVLAERSEVVTRVRGPG
jgi:glycosyltransferase involved in cell wall biosynthesis